MKLFSSRGAVAGLVAALAATLGVPVLVLAPTASAAAPTQVSVSPSAAYISANGSFTFTGQVNATISSGMYSAVLTGPDNNQLSSVFGQACSVTQGTPNSSFSCTVKNGGSVGKDQIAFYYTTSGLGSYQASAPSATATMTIAGPVASISVSPGSAHSAQGVYRPFTVLATDSGSRQAANRSLTVSASQSGAPAGALDVRATAPNSGATYSGTGGSASTTITTADGTNGTSPGGATFWVASTTTGPVGLTVVPTGGSGSVSGTATLIVDVSGPNSVTSVVISPASQNAFTGGPVQAQVTLRNAQGSPVSGVTPSLTVRTGPDVGATVTAGPTDGTGTTTATYTTGAATGPDSLLAWVNRSDIPNPTAGLDNGEYSATSTVNVVAKPDFSSPGGLTNDGPTQVPGDVQSATVTYTLKLHDGTAAAGYNLTFAVSPASGKYTISPANATTDANGKVAVTITDATSAVGDSATITGTLAIDTTVTSAATVNWVARSAATIVISPFAGSSPLYGNSATFTVSATDQFGAPVSGLTYNWLVNSSSNRNTPANNPGATGTGTTFAYSDKSTSTSSGADLVTVTAMSGSTVIGGAYIGQYWFVGDAKAHQANINIPGPRSAAGNVGYVNSNGSIVPVNFNKTYTAGASTDADPQVVPVSLCLVDANGLPLPGKAVSFTSSGVGGFTDHLGKPLANPSSATALVSDGSGASGETVDSAPYQFFATVYVRSSQVGTQSITATVDGVTDSATVTYSNQYVAVPPQRVADTRLGQGGLAAGSSAPVTGYLSADTAYTFAYGNTNMPLGRTAYAFNVTAIGPTQLGNLRVGPSCGGTVPSTSLINYQPGKDSANFVVVPNLVNGKACDGLTVYSDAARVAVAIDFVGYYVDQNAITSMAPYRVLDTRSTGGAIAAGTSRAIQVAGTGGASGVPAAGVQAVAVNVVAVGPKGLGNLRIYPDGGSTPTTSNINYIPGVDKSTFVIVNVPSDGKIDVYSDGSAADVVIDAFAYFPTSSTLVTQVPTRITDTRQGLNGTTLQSGVARTIQVAGNGGVPANARAVLVTITAIHTKGATGSGNLRVYPAGGSTPMVSTINYVSPTTDVANFAIVKLGTNGQLALYSDGSPIDVAVDVLGYVPSD